MVGCAVIKPIDDLLARIPPGWDFWVGSAWDDAGAEVFEVRLQQRAPDHPGHYGAEIERTAGALRAAIEAALAEIERQNPPPETGPAAP